MISKILTSDVIVLDIILGRRVIHPSDPYRSPAYDEYIIASPSVISPFSILPPV